MSINVPQSLLNVSRGVKVAIDMSKFSDRQLKNIAKYVKNLNVPSTNSATSHVAQGLISYLKVPYFKTREDWISWHHIPHEHPIFEAMHRAITVALLTPETNSGWWYAERLKDTKKAIEGKHTIGQVYMYGELIEESVKKQISSMATYKHELSTEANEYLENILTRKVQYFDMEFRG